MLHLSKSPITASSLFVGNVVYCLLIPKAQVIQNKWESIGESMLLSLFGELRGFFFSPHCLPLTAIKTYCPWRGDCKEGAVKVFFSLNRPPVLLSAEQSKQYSNKKSDIWFYRPYGKKSKCNSSSTSRAKKKLKVWESECATDALSMWEGYLYPPVQFELPATVNRSQADTVNLRRRQLSL